MRLMDALRRLTRLMRHWGFRRLVWTRLLSQGGDAAVQVGMAAFILFSPQTQPDAWSIAAMVTLVMAPFALVGPFVGPILDRYSRRGIVVACDILRAVLGLLTAGVVVGGNVSGPWQPLLYGLLLVVLGLNRLQLAALGAGMPFTVDDDEYLEAAAIMPMIGPVAAMAGGLLAAGVRLASGQLTQAGWTDGLVIVAAAVLFAGSVSMAMGFGPRQLGPAQGQPRTEWRQVWTSTSVGVRELWVHRPAFIGVTMVFGARVGYGVLMTLVILMYRHHFGLGRPLDAVMLEMGVWFLVSGLGFALSGLVATPTSERIGVRNTLLAAFVVAALVQLAPGGLLSSPALLVTGFVLGLCLQTVKICGDTLVQAHIADRVRGRVLVVYDIVNNLGFAVGSVAGAVVLPPDGRSLLVVIGLSAWFGLLAMAFGVLSRSEAASYDRGTVLAPDLDHGLA